MTAALSKRRVFMTGASGYLGSRLIPLLLDRGHSVHALLRASSRHRPPAGCTCLWGDPLDGATFQDGIRGCDTFLQLVGTPKPAPWKGAQFRNVDRVSGLASIAAATQSGRPHFIYISVAHPAPIMKDYIAVRAECETALVGSGMPATILRPWYVLGPGHWWPILLAPAYRIAEQWPSTSEAAGRLGLLTIQDMLNALVWSVEHPAETIREMNVPDIRRLTGGGR